MKKIPLDILQEKARLLTKEELRKHILPKNLKEKLTLVIEQDGDHRVFILFVPGHTPKDGIDISRVRINEYSGKAVIEYIGLELKK
ncbi:hypothetical protein [Citrobacter portucalensis]|uniref:Uncharacterized protein n=1 Tax=Citrobacter portucalensis TaxID=1639133 RepID=A0A9X4GGY7_9ENTR|nr:hypothetical protein [Citrobacter portucalensis]MDE9619077.1 hypothetical protein [Citrobacter portucalensis]